MEEVVRFGRFGSENQNVSNQGNRKTEKDQRYWVHVWVKKFSIAAKEQNIPDDKMIQMRALIELFILRNPGSPYAISYATVRKFSQEFSDPGTETLVLFYTFVAISGDHVAVLREISNSRLIVNKERGVTQKTPVQAGTTGNVDVKKFEKQVSKTTADKKTATLPPSPHPVTINGNRTGGIDSVSIKHRNNNEQLSEKERSSLLEKLRLEVKTRNYSRRTNDGYIYSVRKFIDRLTPESSKDWSRAFKEHLVWLLEDQKLAPSTINHHAASIKFFMEEVLELQPGKDVCIRMKTGKALPRVHSAEKISLLINTPSNPKHRLILMLTYGCGLRLGEVQHLKPEDIDIERKLLRVRKGKGKKDRMVMLDETLLPYVVDWLKEGCGTRYLFEGYFAGKAISERTIGKIYNNACNKLGINNQGGIHSLRHSFSTHLLEQGVNLRYIQELLGHASSRTTEIYTHVAAHNISNIRSPIAAII